MNRKTRPTKSAQQIKDEQIGLMLDEIKKDIENLKIISKRIRSYTATTTTTTTTKVAISKLF